MRILIHSFLTRTVTRSVTSFFAIATVGTTVFAQAPSRPLENPVTAKVQLRKSSLVAGDSTEITVQLDVAKNYHAYVDKLRLVLASPDDLKLAPFKASPIVQFHDAVSNSKKDGVEGASTMKALVEVPVGFKPGPQTLKLKVTYQACTNDFCLFPKTIEVQAPFKVIAEPATGPKT